VLDRDSARTYRRFGAGHVTPNADPVPPGEYGLWADDDDVIGLPVARTHPHGYFLIRTNPPTMDGFDEYAVGEFLAACLSNAKAVGAFLAAHIDGLVSDE
jgi:hypothetical protein